MNDHTHMTIENVHLVGFWALTLAVVGQGAAKAVFCLHVRRRFITRVDWLVSSGKGWLSAILHVTSLRR